MSIAKLPRDTTGVPVQALAPDPTGVVSVSIGVTSARGTLPAAADIVRISANKSCYIRFGNSSVDATGSDTLFPIGAEIFRVPAGATHMAAIQDGAVTGNLTITRML